MARTSRSTTVRGGTPACLPEATVRPLIHPYVQLTFRENMGVPRLLDCGASEVVLHLNRSMHKAGLLPAGIGGFGAMESKDQEEEKRIKKNRDLQALMQLRQRNAPDVSDEVARERGENIQIHDGTRRAPQHASMRRPVDSSSSSV